MTHVIGDRHLVETSGLAAPEAQLLQFAKSMQCMQHSRLSHCLEAQVDTPRPWHGPHGSHGSWMVAWAAWAAWGGVEQKVDVAHVDVMDVVDVGVLSSQVVAASPRTILWRCWRLRTLTSALTKSPNPWTFRGLSI